MFILVSAMVMKGIYQPMFFTVRIGGLCVEKHETTSIRLQRCVLSDPEAATVWGQRYTVEPLEGHENINVSSFSDLGELVVAPNNSTPTTLSIYTPDTRLCLKHSFLFRAQENEKVGLYPYYAMIGRILEYWPMHQLFPLRVYFILTGKTGDCFVLLLTVRKTFSLISRGILFEISSLGKTR